MDNQEQICKVVNLSNNDILPNRFQPRKYFDEEDILQLSESIKEHGVINPIIVRKLGDKYELVAGERRYKANILAGNDNIPAIIMDVNDKESSEIAVVENIQRRDLNAIEEAISYKRILDIGYMTQEQLAQKMGKSQSAIANKIRLLKLSDDVQDALMKKQISERHARSLLKLSSQQKQNEMLNRIINERLTVRKTDEEIDKMNNNIYENQSDSLSPVMPVSTVADVNISTIPNYDSVTSIPTEPINDDNQYNNMSNLNSKNQVMESQNQQGQSIPFTVPSLSPINEVVTPIQPNIDSLKNSQQQSSIANIPSLNSNVDINNLSNNNDGIVSPLNPMNNTGSSIPTTSVVEPQNQPSQTVGMKIPSLNPINDIGSSIPSTPIVEPQNQPSQTVGMGIPSLSPINDIGSSIPTPPTVEPQNPSSQSVGMEIPSLNPVNDIGSSIPSAPIVEPQNDIPSQHSNPFNDTKSNNLKDNSMGNNVVPNNNGKNNFKEPQQNSALSFTTSPIIDTTINNQVNDLSDLNNFDNNQSKPQMNNSQFEQIPEPIIVNDYNQQYDPIMPEVENQNPTIDFKTIINLIRKCSAAIENSGYKIETEEYNLDNLYQVVFKIEKK